MNSLAPLVLIAGAAFACDRPTSAPPVATGAAPAASTALAPPPGSVGLGAAEGSVTPPAEPARSGSVVTFDAEPLGAPSPSFEGIVGDWYVAEVAGVRGLQVDGSRWRSGTPSANLADQAKRLYGERYAEFLDGVKAFAFFPFAVLKAEPPVGDLDISVRFFPMAGRIDQAAGIAFAIAPDGTYLGVRANALEDNLLYFRVVKGKRTIIDTVRGVDTQTKVWQTLSLRLREKRLTVYLGAKQVFEKTLDAAPRGKVGLWSKADSQVLFDDFTVTPK
jgi:hypothetical protein